MKRHRRTPEQGIRKVAESKDNMPYSPRLISKTDARALVRQARAVVDAAERL